MGTSATKAKQNYNNKNYQKITLTLSPNLADEFRQNATKNNLSQPQFLEKLLDFFIRNKIILEENQKLKTEKNANKQKIENLLEKNERLESAKIKAEKGDTEKMMKLQTQNIDNLKWFCGASLAIGCILGAFLVLFFSKII